MRGSGSTNTPQIGQLATVRNRRGIVTTVQPFGAEGGDGQLHLVRIEYTDTDGVADEQLIWEREPHASLVSPSRLPNPEASAPMVAADFDALVRATRWTALSPYLDPDEGGPLDRLPIASPFHGAIQVEDFQLVPLIKALRMPRVSLLLADDVGLGKTIEAGLILSELLLRRRVRRVLIICPASLRTQWRQEMSEKFALHFDEVDKDRTHALKRQLGMDANPWRTYSKIVTSYHYLKQPDVLEEFRAASRSPEGSPQLPWDLLIVDEAHNLAPAPFGRDSDLSEALGFITPLFEHRLFLSATPHSGHTRSFSGLLERLDPVRFSRRHEMTRAEKDQAKLLVVRRLKREINASSDKPRFCEREVKGVPLRLTGSELQLAEAYQAFRKKVRSYISSMAGTEQVAGRFAVEVLGKRLLSCPYTFANSWQRYMEGLRDAQTAATATEVRSAEKSTSEETGDDREAESRLDHAVTVIGSWLRPLESALQAEIVAISTAVRALGLDGEAIPSADARFDALLHLIRNLVRTGDDWSEDERIVIFTEYKTTLDYIVRRLSEEFPGSAAIEQLYGGMSDQERDRIKAAFNNPASPVRILVATDAASEGLNLQETARFLLHFDVPWNPSRLEQRNGRLDRHGQARDVTIYHFISDEDADLKFLAHVVRKVETIREDLGSVGEVIESAIHRRLIQGDDEQRVTQTLDLGLEEARGSANYEADNAATSAQESGSDHFQALEALKAELDLDPGTLRTTLSKAFTVAGGGADPFSPPDHDGGVRLQGRFPPAWQSLIDEYLRLQYLGGALPRLVFDPAAFIREINNRPIFRPMPDARLLHLAHPLFQRALATFAMFRFPGVRPAEPWTVRRGDVPNGADALILLTLEEMAVNELRESFHHWVSTHVFTLHDGKLNGPLPHRPARDWSSGGLTAQDATSAARDLWLEAEPQLLEFIGSYGRELTGRLMKALEVDGKQAGKEEVVRFASRQGELSKLIESTTVEALRTEIEEIERGMKQRMVFDEDQVRADLARKRAELEEEIKFRTTHYEELREQLNRERDRVVNLLIPKRHSMRGEASVFPVAIEIRLPGSNQ